MGWLGDALGKLGGALPVVGPLVSAGLGVIEGAGKQGKANQLRDQVLAQDQQDYTARAPVRNLALQRALQGIPQRPDLGQLFSGTGNPYERPALARPPVAMPPTAAPVPAQTPGQTAFSGAPPKAQDWLRRMNPNLDQLLARAPGGAGPMPGGGAPRFPIAMPPSGPTY